MAASPTVLSTAASRAAAKYHRRNAGALTTANQVAPAALGLRPATPGFLPAPAADALPAQLAAFVAAHPSRSGAEPTALGAFAPRAQLLLAFDPQRPAATYPYPGMVLHSVPAPAFLHDLHRRVQDLAGYPLPHAILNTYLPGTADAAVGEDCIHWHRDVHEIRGQADIYSYSVGGERYFRVKTDPVLTGALRWCKVRLHHNDLLVFPHAVNAQCFHAVLPSTPEEVAALGQGRCCPRYNVTFRRL